jgi:hypothetical protein
MFKTMMQTVKLTNYKKFMAKDSNNDALLANIIKGIEVKGRIDTRLKRN